VCQNKDENIEYWVSEFSIRKTKLLQALYPEMDSPKLLLPQDSPRLLLPRWNVQRVQKNAEENFQEKSEHERIMLQPERG
jgi:hypothetical protein